MTREEIMKLEGRELDAEVAEKVMGWIKIRNMSTGNRTSLEGFPPGVYGSTRVKKYSADISAAFTIIPMIKHFQLQRRNNGNFTVRWAFKKRNGWDCTEAETAPEAICKAALIAVMEATP